MMELFLIQPDNDKWGKQYKYDIDAHHPWAIPGIKCPTCGKTWAWIGVSYPLVDLSTRFVDLKIFKPHADSVEVYEKLRDLVKPLVPKDLPIPPGTNFGPFIGKGWGKLGDFVWVNRWNLIVQQEAYKKLSDLRIKMPEAVVPKILFKGNRSYDLLEMQIEPHSFLSPISYSIPEPQLCLKCGRDSRKEINIIVNKTSIPHDHEIFRITDFPTYILVTNKIKDAIVELGLTNIKFSNIPIE